MDDSRILNSEEEVTNHQANDGNTNEVIISLNKL